MIITSKNQVRTKKKNKVKGLSTIYNMDSNKQMTDNNFEKSGPDKKENKVKGLSTIYNMDSNKTDGFETNIHKSPRYKCS